MSPGPQESFQKESSKDGKLTERSRATENYIVITRVSDRSAYLGCQIQRIKNE